MCMDKKCERNSAAISPHRAAHPIPAQALLYLIAHIFLAPGGLCLTAACCATVRRSAGADTCSNTINPARRQTPAGLANSGYLLVLHFHQRASSPTATLGHRLLVRGEVEGEEEEEVRRDDADAGDGGEFFAGALAHVWHFGPVGAGEVGVGCEVDEAWGC